MWKKLSSKTILNHPRLHVVEDEVELPSGQKTDYVRFEMKGNAPTIIAINNENKILIIKEYSYPVDEWLFQFPAGMVPFSEDLEQGINRELMEEAGLKATKLELLGDFYINNRRSNYKGYVFVGTNLIEEKRAGDLEESIESMWMSEAEIDQLISENKFKNSSSLAAWAVYKSTRSYGEK